MKDLRVDYKIVVKFREYTGLPSAQYDGFYQLPDDGTLPAINNLEHAILKAASDDMQSYVDRLWKDVVIGNEHQIDCIDAELIETNIPLDGTFDDVVAEISQKANYNYNIHQCV